MKIIWGRYRLHALPSVSSWASSMVPACHQKEKPVIHLVYILKRRSDISQKRHDCQFINYYRFHNDNVRAKRNDIVKIRIYDHLLISDYK